MSKRDIKTISIFSISKIHQNKRVQVASIFHQNWIKKYTETTSIEIRSKKKTWKWRRFFSHQNCVKQSTSKWPRFFAHQSYIKKVRWNDAEIYRYFFFKILKPPVDIVVCPWGFILPCDDSITISSRWNTNRLKY